MTVLFSVDRRTPLLETLPPIVELRQYTLRDGRRDELIDLFEREFSAPQEALGITLVGLFRDAHRPNRFVWLRGFEDMGSRRAALEGFYGGPVWKAYREAANATMIDSNNVLLLRSAGPPVSRALRGPLLCLTYRPESADAVRELARVGGTVVATFFSERSANTFPQLPVREGEDVFVALVDGARHEDALKTTPIECVELVPATGSKIQLEFRGNPGDFDFMTGEWTVTHRRLRERLSANDDWEIMSGAYRGWSLLDGLISIDEMDVPGNAKGSSIRHLDIAAQRWSIYWTNNTSGALFPPVHGGFANGRGEFYGTDSENGTPVLARYVWSECKTSTPRWEQAFSIDGGTTWETNWVMEFTRARAALEGP